MLFSSLRFDQYLHACKVRLGAASQGEFGTFAVPRHRLHKPGPKVSIFQVISIVEILAKKEKIVR